MVADPVVSRQKTEDQDSQDENDEDDEDDGDLQGRMINSSGTEVCQFFVSTFLSTFLKYSSPSVLLLFSKYTD